MECKEFWEEVARFLLGEKALSPEMEGHLAVCKRCSEDYILIHSGLKDLKNEILAEEPAQFWHEMKEMIRDGVKNPGTRFFFKGCWRLAWIPACAVSIALAIGIFHYKRPVTYSSTELMLLAGAHPEVIAPENGDLAFYLDKEDIEVSPSIYTGITDEWSALLMEVTEGS